MFGVCVGVLIRGGCRGGAAVEDSKYDNSDKRQSGNQEHELPNGIRCDGAQAPEHGFDQEENDVLDGDQHAEDCRENALGNRRTRFGTIPAAAAMLCIALAPASVACGVSSAAASILRAAMPTVVALLVTIATAFVR